VDDGEDTDPSTDDGFGTSPISASGNSATSTATTGANSAGTATNTANPREDSGADDSVETSGSQSDTDTVGNDSSSVDSTTGTIRGCGNGLIEGVEECDDGDEADDDGCSSECAIEADHICGGEPSTCLEFQVHGLGSQPDATIVDGAYDGSLASMTCVSLPFDRPAATVVSVDVELGIEHAYIGDLTLKLVSAQGTVVTLVSRPGLDESADDGSTVVGAWGDSSNLAIDGPIRFVSSASDDAETMGNTIGAEEHICQDDFRCAYVTNPGAAAAGELVTLMGEPASGTWQVCAADSTTPDPGQLGTIDLLLETLGPPS
jgi:cysteine-rich repeat protein